MQVTIVGLPGSGKTTVFNALTGGHAETGGFSGGRAAPNVSVVKVPDERVDRLAALFSPKKTTYADVTYVDVAIPAGAAREGTVNPDVLAQVRNADALLHVARAFDDPAAAARPIRGATSTTSTSSSPWPTSRSSRSGSRSCATQGRHGSQAERDQAQREEELLRRAGAASVRGQADPLVRPDRRRGAAPARLPVPDPEAGAGRAEHRRGSPAGGRRARGRRS